MYHFALVNFHHPLVVNLETRLFLEGLALKHFSSVGLLTFPSNIIWSVWGKVEKVVIFPYFRSGFGWENAKY